MFTSGSTGEPKGVAVPHRGIVRLARNSNYAQFGTHTRATLYSNPAFDASTLEIWGPLLNGGTVVTIERAAVLDSKRLKRSLNENNITLMRSEERRVGKECVSKCSSRGSPEK